MSTMPVKVRGFTPVPDKLAARVGFVQAAVFGVVWRHCKMRRKVCDASLETLAGELQISRKTVERHVKELCEKGYLEDLTPDRKNAPHQYRDTGKYNMAMQMIMEGETESLTEGEQRTDAESDCLDLESDRSDRESHQGKTESLTRKPPKETKEETKGNNNSAHAPPEKPSPSHNPNARSAFAADPDTREGWGGDNAATPSQAGGASPIAEAIANQIVTHHNEIPGGLGSLGKKDRRAWVKMLQGVLDQYGPLTPAQARLVGDAWCVYNSFRTGPANPYHTSMPGDIGPLVARVLAGTLTAEGLRAEAAGKGKGKKKPLPRPKPQERTPEEEVAIRRHLAEQAERRKA